MANSSVYLGTPGSNINNELNRFFTPFSSSVLADIITLQNPGPTETTVSGSFSYAGNSFLIPNVDLTSTLINGLELKLTDAPFSFGYAIILNSAINGTDTEVFLQLTDNGPGGFNLPNTEAGLAFGDPLLSIAAIYYGLNYNFAIPGGVTGSGGGGLGVG